MKFFVVGGYSLGNPGDESILKATLYRIAEQFPRAFFYIWNDNDQYRIRFDRPIRHRVVFWKLPKWMYRDGFWSRVIVKAYTDFFPLSRRFLMRLHPPAPRLVRALRDSDKVLFLGGGYLNSRFSLYKMNYLASWISSQSRPLLLLGQTLGPFEKPSHDRIAAEIFRVAEAIVVRDPHSGREAVEMQEKVLNGADDAIGFNPRPTPAAQAAMDAYFEKADPEVLHFGLNLRRWEDSRKFYPRIAETLEACVQAMPQRKVRWYFIPMETSRYCDDRCEAREFLRHCRHPEDVVLIQKELTVEEKSYLFSRLDLLIGMRFHSLVFALNSGVPAIGLYYQSYYRRKVCGLLQSFGLERFALPLDGMERLPRLVAEISSRKADLRQWIQEAKAGIARRQAQVMHKLLEV